MKKFCVLILFCVFCLSACAEEFTLHSGVKFLMPIEKVISMEQEKGFEIIKRTETPDENAGNLNDMYDDVLFYYGKGRIAGVDDSLIAYFPDEDGNVFRMQYALNITEKSGEITIIDALVQKYGNPDYAYGRLPVNIKLMPENRGVYAMEAGGLPASYAEWNEEFEVDNVPFSRSCRYCYTWLYNVEDGNTVIIDFSNLWFEWDFGGDSASEGGYYVTYTLLPQENTTNEILDDL